MGEFLKKALRQQILGERGSFVPDDVGLLLVKLASYDTTINGQPDRDLETVKLELLTKSVRMLAQRGFPAESELAKHLILNLTKARA